MKKRITTVTLLISLSIFIQAILFSEDKDGIVWIKAEIPPYYISEGKYQDDGIADNIIKILEANMKNYSHKELKNVPVSRMEIMMKNEWKVCFVTTLKTTTREKFMYFSLPTVINPPQAIITTKAKYKLFGLDREVSLERLMADKTMRVGIADRSYGAIIDNLINKNEKSINIYKRAGADVFIGLLEMLAKDRIDYIIGTPYEVNYASELFGNKIEIIALKIKETKDEKFLLSYAAFPKNEWGNKVRDEVDIVLEKERKTEQYKALFNRWLDDNSKEWINNEWEIISK